MDRASATSPMLLLGFAAVVMFASPALAFNEPDGFRGAMWGASEVEVREEVGVILDCFEVPDAYRWVSDRLCRGVFDLGGVRIDVRYKFRAGKFTGVSLTFPLKDFDMIEWIFLERYGTTTSSEAAVNRRHLWDGPRVIINLRKYGEPTGQSSANVLTQEELAESTRLRGERHKDAAKRL